MSVVNELEGILSIGLKEDNFAIKSEEIEKLEKMLREIEGNKGKKGYTLPQIDTVGMSLNNNFGCRLRNF